MSRRSFRNGRTKTYGQIVSEARHINDHQEVGETTEAVMDRFKTIIEDAVQKNYENGITGKYYIHIWVQKDPYTQNALHIYPQCRRTRPSPYQGNDHYLWSVKDGGEVTFEWCIPKQEVVKYILAHPHDYDVAYVTMLKKFTEDKIESITDYLVGDKVL